MEKGQEDWRLSLKEPPPPYIEDERDTRTPPLTPTHKRRSSVFSLFPSSSRKSDSTSTFDDSSVNLTAASLENKLQASDLKFAKVIIQLMAPKLEEGHLSYLEGSGWGYTFSDDTVENPDYKRCQLDRMLGFNAYAYRKRLGKVEDLAWQDLQRRGFHVKFLEICVTDLAMGVKWILDI